MATVAGGKNNVTERCQKIMEKEEVVSNGVKYKKCDPAEALKVSGAHDEWSKLREDVAKDYKDRCSNDSEFKSQSWFKGYQALNCDECAIIADRLFVMNKKALGTGCSDGALGPIPAATGGEGVF
jgi:hypothetical protein